MKPCARQSCLSSFLRSVFNRVDSRQNPYSVKLSVGTDYFSYRVEFHRRNMDIVDSADVIRIRGSAFNDEEIEVQPRYG